MGEAQRAAVREMKDLHDKRGNPGAVLRHGKNGKRSSDDMNQNEG